MNNLKHTCPGIVQCLTILLLDLRETAKRKRYDDIYIYIYIYILRLRKCTIRDSFETFRINPLTPNDSYSGRTAPLTSKFAFYIFIQQIHVLNILNMVYTVLFFSSKCSWFHNSNVFGSCFIHILYTVC